MIPTADEPDRFRVNLLGGTPTKTVQLIDIIGDCNDISSSVSRVTRNPQPASDHMGCQFAVTRHPQPATRKSPDEIWVSRHTSPATRNPQPASTESVYGVLSIRKQLFSQQ